MRTGPKPELGLSVSESPFQAALQSVTRPLEFAARDHFAGAGRVRNLESTLADACRKVGELSVPQDVRECLEAIRGLFLEPLEGESRAAAVEKGLALAASISASGVERKLLGRSPTCFSGVGPKRASVLSKRGINTVLDLLFLFPLRYDDRRSLVRTAELEVGRRATFVRPGESAKTSRRKGAVRTDARGGRG